MVSFNTTSAILEKIISDKAPDHDLIPKKLWVAKCVQMIHAANVSKSSSFDFSVLPSRIDRYFYADMILCGAPHSGKSTAAMVMIDILTQMQQQHQLQTSAQSNKISSTSNDAQEIAAQTHKLYR